MRSRAGAKVRRGGVYSVIHYGHRAPHQAILQEGESFPSCRHCGTAVLFEFLEPLRQSSDSSTSDMISISWTRFYVRSGKLGDKFRPSWLTLQKERTAP
jgi:hypothetical protein